MAGNLAVGLDVGTSKICAVAAELNDRGVNILGVGEAPSKGLRKGIIINMDATIDSIKKAVMEVEASRASGSNPLPRDIRCPYKRTGQLWGGRHPRQGSTAC
jgi:cell division ATPase FtsA